LRNGNKKLQDIESRLPPVAGRQKRFERLRFTEKCAIEKRTSSGQHGQSATPESSGYGPAVAEKPEGQGTYRAAGRHFRSYFQKALPSRSDRLKPDHHAGAPPDNVIFVAALLRRMRKPRQLFAWGTSA